EPSSEALDSPAAHGRHARINEVHLPVFALALVDIHAAAGEIDAEAVAETEVVEKEGLDDVGLVTQRDHELVEAALGVQLHDVPEDRHTADFNHRLGARYCLFGQ